MKMGAEPKKIAALAILMPVAGYMMYSSLSDTGGPPGQSRPAQAAASKAPAGIPAFGIPRQAAAGGGARTAPPAGARRRGAALSQEWVPTLRPRRPEDAPDPAKTDPALRLDLLAKLQDVSLAGGNRSLFEFSSAPPPPLTVPDPKIKPAKPKPGEVEAPKVDVAGAEPTKPVTDPPKPAPPPIPLKFYGFVSGSDGKRAFFLNGEDIFVGSEGSVLQNRYKLVRIGLNSAVIEDTQFKDHQQTVPLEEPPANQL
jgi:hypothetical protein